MSPSKSTVLKTHIQNIFELG